LLILIVELALILAVAALGYYQPLAFAALTFVIALAVGARLEVLRLQNEITFYFDRDGQPARRPSMWLWMVALSEAMFKAVLAGVVALITFSGTDPNRLFWVATVLAVCIFTGSSILRWLTNRFGARPGRWGYFRIGAPLGLMFSAAMAALPAPTYAKLGWDLLFNLSARPTLNQGSEMLFLLKQKFDELCLALLQTLLSLEVAQVVAVLVSVNMLTGFVAGLYAVLAAETVRALEGGSS
ncbi:MAG: hypothetical protein K2Y05_03435, partial [Hyphomicrobiaceae bacterium]|nr:hypothetical protein [Hyphomicrobiaceae bacterium]